MLNRQDIIYAYIYDRRFIVMVIFGTLRGMVTRRVHCVPCPAYYSKWQGIYDILEMSRAQPPVHSYLQATRVMKVGSVTAGECVT